MGGRRRGNKICQAIYTPGSGPLKRTGQKSSEFNSEITRKNLSTIPVQDDQKHSCNETLSSLKNSAYSSYQDNNTLEKRLNTVPVDYRHTRNNNSQNGSMSGYDFDDNTEHRLKNLVQPLYEGTNMHQTVVSKPDAMNNLSAFTGWSQTRNREGIIDKKMETESDRNQKSDNPHLNYEGRQAGNGNHNIEDAQHEIGHRKESLGYRSRRTKFRSSSDSEFNWRQKSPTFNRSYGKYNFEIHRNVRLNSDSSNNGMVSNNMKDTSPIRDERCLAPLGFDQFQRKSLIGFRGYTKGNSINIDSLPPRLNRKYLAENNTDTSLIFEKNLEESRNAHLIQSSFNVVHSPVIQYSHVNSIRNSSLFQPNTPVFGFLPPSSQWSDTVPICSRGRGRFRPEELEELVTQPGTLDKYPTPRSRSLTPSQEITKQQTKEITKCTSMESLSHSDSRRNSLSLQSRAVALSTNQILTKNENLFLNNCRPLISSTSVQNQLYSYRGNNSSNIEKRLPLDKTRHWKTTLRSSKSEKFGSMPDISSDILDWSEEVELCEKLENERSSRSSSIQSSRSSGSMRRNRLLGSNAEMNCVIHKKKHDKRRTCNPRHIHENFCERKNNEYNKDHENQNNQKNSINEKLDNKKEKNKHLSRESSKEQGRHCDVNKNRFDVTENWQIRKRISRSESTDGRGNSSIHTLPMTFTSSNAPPGVLILPQSTQSSPTFNVRHSYRKTLFDPDNPYRSIIDSSMGNSTSSLSTVPSQTPMISSKLHSSSHLKKIMQFDGASSHYIADQMTNPRPSWYDLCAGSGRSPKNTCLLIGVEQVDRELQFLLCSGSLTTHWDRITFLRQSLQQSLQDLLISDMKFCQAENVEQHFWKIIFYNIIENLRKVTSKEGSESRGVCRKIMLEIIDDGILYFENLLCVLENTYKFKLDSFLSWSIPPKGLGFVGLALVSAQKIFLFLGDLARYREQTNETTNYGKSRQWYIKAQQMNPKNGRPYNQLALLAHYARRRLDAVYYYMRSLMASNPFQSARESLIGLFDENRKKYESMERKRKEERNLRERARMREKESVSNFTDGLRREIWIHPGGKRMRRTASTAYACESKLISSDSEGLLQLSSVEVNKRFVTSYLHVNGKLITKIGIETFGEAAIQMLREFRSLLQHSPLPLSSTRLLQLLALNMFAIETTQLKGSQLEQGYRSEIQERALAVSLQMFNLILERSVALLKEQIRNEEQPSLVVNDDMQVLLPAIKIWCDWMLCHSTVWNPPPSCTDYRVGPPDDVWSRLALITNLLEQLPTYSRKILIHGHKVGSRENELDLVRLPEDATLAGFTPLMSNPQETFYVLKTDDIEVAQVCLRIYKILFFGQVFLCGLETPVFKLHKNDYDMCEYVSLVETFSASSLNSPAGQSDSELLVDSYSEGEDESSTFPKHKSNDSNTGSEIRLLIQRKGELEKRQRRQERHRQRVQVILQKSSISMEIEVKPRQLVPDTNCFIDYLSQLQRIAKSASGAQPLYTLMVPLVVLNELEGLTRGAHANDFTPVSRATLNPEHIARVAASAKAALNFVRNRNPAVRCITTRGTVLSSSTFTVEEGVTMDGLISNDDKILATCISLFKTTNKNQTVNEQDDPRHLMRDVVLLTEDRNLKVKALARDVPVRGVQDFIQWAGLN